MVDLQAVVDAMGAAGQLARRDYHLTLGAAINALAALPDAMPISIDATGNAPGEADSYRGYYEDLALEPSGEFDTAGKLLGELRRVNGQVLQGYKGGDFRMCDSTVLWICSYGTTAGSLAVTGLQERDGRAVIITRPVNE